MILGCDAAGIDADGNEVVVYPVVGQSGHGVGPDEPRSILTERYQGTFAEQVTVPAWNVLPKPKELTFEEAACLPTAWLTAYRMLFTKPVCGPAIRSSCRAQAAVSPPPRSSSPRPQGCGSTRPAGTRPSASGRWSWARTACSSPARGCRTGSTRSSRRSAPPPGRTRSSPCGPAALW